MLVREAQWSDETDDAFLEREEANLEAIAKNRARLLAIRGRIESLFGQPKRRVHDIIGRERKL